MKSNKCFTKIISNPRNKSRSKSESICKPIYVQTNKIRNIQIKEGDFNSDIHKSDLTVSIRETSKGDFKEPPKPSERRKEPNLDRKTDEKEPQVIFLKKDQSKSELHWTP